LRLLGSPVHVSPDPFAVRRPPPLLGQHTAEVLGAVADDE
jgi:crotonobetainyl-CoA:carnitine CoA-transferase CaiB-like acyl-CoA transferase